MLLEMTQATGNAIPSQVRLCDSDINSVYLRRWFMTWVRKCGAGASFVICSDFEAPCAHEFR
jgi:hypothetical protein